jgi:transposase
MTQVPFIITKEQLAEVSNRVYKIILRCYSKLQSYRKVAENTSVPFQTVGWIVKTYKNNPQLLEEDKRGRPKAISERTGRVILKDITNNPNLTLKEIKYQNNFAFSTNTISRFLNDSDITNKSPTKAIVLTRQQKECRLEFANKNIFNDFSKVFFSDEKRFCLDGPDHYKKVWTKKNDQTAIVNRSQAGRKGIMIHMVIAFNSNGFINEMVGNFNSADFIHLFDEKILPLIEDPIRNHGYIFQQDNCPIHVSKETKQYFAEKEIETLHWPPRSPDLNIIEIVFSILTRIIYKNGAVYQNCNELWAAISKAHIELSTTEINNLYYSIQDRLLSVIEKGGGMTKY